MTNRRISIWFAVWLALVTITGQRPILSSAQDQTSAMFTNPVLNIDFPDPDVLKVGNTYYAYATNGNGLNIQVEHSADLVHWKGLTEGLPRLPKWAVQQFGFTWAPEVTTISNGTSGAPTFLMYFVVRFPTTSGGKQCIGTATSDHPDGPFTPRDDRPFICQLDQGGSIDPDSFVDDDGTHYVLWKNDGNSEGKRTWLYIQPVSADGQTLQGQPTALITNDQPWEGNLVEAPILWKHAGRYYVFYSANDYIGRKYAVGYAVASSITGPYTKPATTPFLASDSAAGISGPGGEDITVDAAGQTWMVFHSWAIGGFRRLNLIRLSWANGLPVVAPFSRAPQSAPLTISDFF
ncbi:MAG: glycoside hydrolase family 43 protein [Aggregatilineales bacterium]